MWQGTCTEAAEPYTFVKKRHVKETCIRQNKTYMWQGTCTEAAEPYTFVKKRHVNARTRSISIYVAERLVKWQPSHISIPKNMYEYSKRDI